MKLTIIILSLFAVAVLAEEKPAQVKGRGCILDTYDAAAVASMNDLITAARTLDIMRERRLASSLDKVGVYAFLPCRSTFLLQSSRCLFRSI